MAIMSKIVQVCSLDCRAVQIGTIKILLTNCGNILLTTFIYMDI